MQEVYLISIHNKRELVTAFSGVFRVRYPNTIFFNPMVIFNMALKQRILDRTGEDFKHQLDHLVKLQKIFLAMKIVHEITNLLDIRVSPSIIENGITPCKVIVEAVKEGTKAVQYDDMGTLMEKELFGGCIEMKSDEDHGFMELDQIGIYKSTGTMWGHYLDVDRSSISDTDGEVIISLGDEFRSTYKPSFNRINLKVGGVRASILAAGCGVMPPEEGDEEEDEYANNGGCRA